MNISAEADLSDGNFYIWVNKYIKYRYNHLEIKKSGRQFL